MAVDVKELILRAIYEDVGASAGMQGLVDSMIATDSSAKEMAVGLQQAGVSLNGVSAAAAEATTTVGALSGTIKSMDVALAQNQAQQLAATASLEALSAAGITDGAVVVGLQAKIEQLAVQEGYLATVTDSAAAATAREAEAQAAAATATERNILSHGRLGAGIGGLSGGISGLNLGVLAVGGAMLYAADQSAKFGTEMLHLQSNTHLTDADMQQVRQSILSMGEGSGQAFDKLATGFRQVKDFGFSAADTVRILSEANKNAVATGADLSDTSMLLGATLKVFGGSAQDATGFMNVMFEDARSGNVTMQQFASSMERVYAIAAGFGAQNGLVDLGAAFAALTANGIPATRAATGLIDILNKIENPTAAAKKELANLNEQTGHMVNDFNAGGLATVGLKGVIDELVAAYEKLGLTQADAAKATDQLITGIRGGNIAVVLASTAYKDYTKNIEAGDTNIKTSTANQDAYNKALDTTAVKFAALTNLLKGGAISGGDVLGPSAINVFESVFHLDLWVKALEDQRKAVEDTKNHNLEQFAAMDAGIAESDRKMADATRNSTLDMTDDLDAYQKFVDGATTKATSALDKHADDFKTVKDSLESDLNRLKAKYDEYMQEAMTSCGTASDAAAQHATTVKVQMDLIKGDLVGAEQAWKDYQAAAGGNQLQQFNQLKIDTAPARNAATVADAQAAASASIAGSTDTTKTNTQVVADNAKANVDAAAAVVAHDKATLAQAQGLDKLNGVMGKSVETLAAEGKLAQDSATLTDAQTKSIGAQTAVTEENNRIKAQAARDALTQNEQVTASQDAVSAAQTQHSALVEKNTQLTKDSTAALDALKYKQGETWPMAAAEINKATDALRAHGEATAWVGAATSALHTYIDALAATTVAEKNLKDFQEQSKTALAGMDEQLYQTGLKMLSDKEFGEVMLKPLIADAKVAADALTAIQTATKTTDEAYAVFARTLNDELYANAQAEAVATAEIDKRIASEKLAIQSESDRVAVLQNAYTKEQAAVTELGASYDRELNPKIDELNKLKQKDTELQHAQTLHDEQQSVENLSQQLSRLTAGTSEYQNVAYQLGIAKDKEGRDAKEFSLEKEIAGLEAQKKAALDTANQRLAADKAVLDAAQEKLRLDNLQLHTDEETRASIAKTFEDTKTRLTEEIALVQHAQSEYDYAQHQKEIGAQADKDRADQALKRAQDLQTSLIATDQTALDGITAVRNAKVHDDAIEAARLTAIVTSDKTASDAAKLSYDTQINLADDHAKAVAADAAAQEQSDSRKVASLSKTVTDMQRDYATISRLEAAAKAGAQLTPQEQAELAAANKALGIPIGSSIVDGMVQGVTDNAQKIKDAVAGAATGAVQAGKDAIISKSPSQLSRYEIGVPIGEGIAQGVADTLGVVESAMNALISGAIHDIGGYANFPSLLPGGTGVGPSPGAYSPAAGGYTTMPYGGGPVGGGGDQYHIGQVVIQPQTLPHNQSEWDQVIHLIQRSSTSLGRRTGSVPISRNGWKPL